MIFAAATTGRHRRLLSLARCLVFCAAWNSAARAETGPDIAARFAIHDHFDRLVLTLPDAADVSSRQDGTVLSIHTGVPGVLAASTAAGHRLLGFEGANGDISVRLAPGTHPHVWRLNDRLVVDVIESDAEAAEAASASPVLPARMLAGRSPSAAGIVQLAPAQPVLAENLAAPERSHAATPPALAIPSIAPPLSGPIEVGQAAASLARAAITLQPADGNSAGPGFLVPFGSDAGAAAFRRGAVAHIVFDTARPLDLGQLKDDTNFGELTERLLPDGVDLRLPIAPASKLLLSRQQGGWLVSLVHDLPAHAPIAAHAERGVLSFAAAAAGRTVVLDDEATGGKLLVATQRLAGQDMAAAHQSAEFAILPSWQGIVVSPHTDRIALAPMKDGFRLSASSGPKLSVLWGDESGHVMTRRFDLPDLPPSVLQNRLTLAERDAALTPKLARFVARLRVAQAMLAEGLDVEARAVLHAATADDPAHADDADAAGLSAIANWLIARAGGATPPPPDNFDIATLGDSDEAQFWRALLMAGQADQAAPAASLAATWPLLQQYPAALRRRLLPSVGEILSRGGQDKALTALLAAFPDQSLDLVRADLLKRQGRTDQALAMLDAVAGRSNRLMRAAARRDAIETRLAARRIDVAAAAAALGREIYAWRGGPGDLALRMRVADLRAQAGQWRPALALLRETDTLFPEQHGQIHGAESQIVAALLRGDSANRLSAIDLVALAEESAPLLSAADADITLAPVLVDKLLALDLPARAEPILQRLFDHAVSPVQKAELGVRLAGLMADRDAPKAALGVLDVSDDNGLDSRLVVQRGLLRARLLVSLGRTMDALGILSGVEGEPALELRTKILEDRHEFASAAKLLEALLSAPDFSARPAQAQRDLILRLANDESEAGDMAGLRLLRSAQGARFASGPGAELFAVLTAEPVQAVDDLPRSSRELQAVRALPASLATH